MKLPLSWLKDYVDIDCTAEELESRLFSCGFEVEEKITVGGKTDRIVCCKILSIEKHPNADRLSVVKADAGKFGILQIITQMYVQFLRGISLYLYSEDNAFHKVRILYSRKLCRYF